MKKTIEQLHSEVLDYLIEKRKEYPDLCFTLRKTNEQGRLARGHWFWGNEEQLYFSFWNGTDWTVSAPNISITINLEGKMLVYLNGRDSPRKADFFMELVQLLGKFQRNKKYDYAGIAHFENQWQRRYTLKNENWKTSLDDFLTQKYKIDTLLEISGNDIDGLAPLRPFLFEDHLKETIIYKNRLTNSPKTKTTIPLSETGKHLKLKSIKLDNIGHFQTLTIDLSKQITVLIGENGSGKSTILKAIALGLSGTTDPIICANYLQILETTENGVTKFSKNGSIEITYTLNKQQVTSLDFESTELGGVNISVRQDTEDDWLLMGKNCFIDLVLGFPQGKKREGERKLGNSLTEPNVDDLIDLIEDRDAQRFQLFLKDWVINLYREPDHDKRRINLEKIDLVFQIFSKIISNGENTNAITLKTAVEDVERGIKAVIVCTPDAPHGISLDLISQGYNNIFIWVGRLINRLYATLEVHRAYNEKPEELAGKFIADPQKRGTRYEANTVKDLYGIVLLDEIDTYLHPKWQRNILKVLVEEFPKLQFIVTTHSPLIISNLSKNDITETLSDGTVLEVKGLDYTIYNLKKDKERNDIIADRFLFSEFYPFASKANRTLSYMDLSERPEIIMHKFNRLDNYITHINQDKSLIIEAEKLIGELKTIIDPYDADLLRMENMLNFKKSLGR